MATSIVHRVTGVGLTLGMAGLAWWLIALATGPDQYAFFTAIARTPLGQLVIFGFLWALGYHLINGIRHLAWDIGLGFGAKFSNRLSVVIILASIVLAAAVFLAGYYKLTGAML